MSNQTILSLTAATGLLLGYGQTIAQTTQPVDGATAAAAWEFAGVFAYDRPKQMLVEASTPTPAQLTFYSRPPQLSDADLKLKSIATAKPRTLGPVDIVRLRFTDADGDIVPALLCTPKGKTGPFPLAVAIHGLNSNKAQVCGQLAPSLAGRGFAVLAPDMPLHGERAGNWRDLQAKQDWLTAIQLHRRAIIDIRQCIDLAEQRPELDVKRGVVLCGYSMGSWLDSIAGPTDPRVKAMVLMVGGATDAAPMLRMLPALAAADPLHAIAAFAGRPLLMLNGTNDEIVTRDMAERLFAAAPEPKKQKWYDSGHHLPDAAYDYAAAWVARTWASLAVATP